MNLSAPFIARPVATTLLTIGLALAGLIAFFGLPVSPLPKIDFPTIQVTASLPGASPETVATSVTTPLERRLGAIAGVTEITSSSTVGNSRITLQFDLSRDIDGAARDVQAAISAARADLPADLRSNPQYRKINPADAPVMVIALTSNTLGQGRLFDAGSNILQQKLSQVSGVGQVQLGGSSLPAVRVELNPTALNKYGIGLESVRAALAAANANSPKGAIEVGERRFQIYSNDQASVAAEYRPLIIAWRNGAPVRLSDVAEVIDSTENIRNEGQANGKRSVLVIIYKQPNANIIETVDEIKALLPELQASMPNDVELQVVSDRTTTIRAALKEVEQALVIGVVLVVLVTFAFLRSARAGFIAAVTVPVSLVATFGGMYLLGYSLNNLSLMALTIAAGFVVDDAIIVLENVSRHIEAGMSRMEAALKGAREVGFTVVSMSVSLIAVFIPILLMSGIVGRLFREFAVTLSIAILISMVVSLTTTPMMCAYVLRPPGVHREPGFLARLSERGLGGLQRLYGRSLGLVLRYPLLTMFVFLATVILNIHLYVTIPKGFFPQQDTGRIMGGIRADQSISFQAMRRKFRQFVEIVRSDPAIESVAGFTGGGQTNSGFLFATLKPLGERDATADQVIARLRPKLAQVPGAMLFLQAVQDIRVGGRQGNAQYQFTLQADSLSDLYTWGPRLTQALQADTSVITDVDSDQQQRGLQLNLTIDRDAASRLGISTRNISATLYDAFGQRQVSTIYNALNQYHVVMEVAPQWWESPESLKDIYVSKSGGALSGTQTTGSIAASTTGSTSTGAAGTGAQSIDAAQAVRNLRTNQIAVSGRGSASTGAAVSTTPETLVPLSAVTRWDYGTTPLAVNHQSMFVASTVSFNLAPGKTLSDAVQYVNDTMREIGVPTTLHGAFQGTARAFQQSLDNQLLLVLAALAAVYIVLGVLYESYIHPITILSTLPSAGIGALLALQFSGVEFSIIAMIGVLLLIGIVKKNAIMMIDVALERERGEGLEPSVAIHQAAILRFRPILMTTMAAILGALPLAVGYGDGAELRRPLGISIIGGLIVSQILTLYTTPVIYLYLDRFRRRDRDRPSRVARAMGSGGAGMRRSAALLPLLLVSGCLVGPDYERAPPASPVAPQYKEAELPPGAASLFRPAQPSDGVDRGQWWRVYGDPTLDSLAAQVDISNQNLKIFEANYRRARALIRQDQSALYPNISGTGAAEQSGTGGLRGTGSNTTSTVRRYDSTVGQYSTGFTLNWEIDLWGTLRRQVESDSAAAQASDADLANARLSAQTDLVTNYASLRISDDRKRLYEATVAAYLRSMQIAQNQVDAGIVSRVDLVQAQTQYEQTRAQLVNEAINRALLEHAIALLVGKAPSEVTIEPAPTRLTVPTVDSGVPSSLLERRPDIASAERQMAAANAQIGVAKGAYYPQISLGATIGFLSGGLGSLLQLGTAAWSVGPQIAGTLVDGGGIAAQVQDARASYDATVATYRQTILTAFQQVEDELARQRILVQQERVQRAAVAAAREAERLSLNQYRVGTVPYTTVVQTQASALSAEQALLTIRLNRLIASANLVKALGGGWRQEDLPPPVPIGGLKQANPAPPAFPPPGR